MKYKQRYKYYLLFSFILIFISIMVSLYFINFYEERVNVKVMSRVEMNLKRKINKLVNDVFSQMKFDNKLVSLIKNRDDEIILVDYETEKMKKIITETTNSLTNKIKEIYKNRENCIIDEINFGLVFDNIFLNNLGPKFKIRFEFIDSIVSNIETEIKPYGLNNAYLEIRLCVEIRAKIYMPFLSKELIILNKVPISMNIVQGNIPRGYIGSYK